MTQKPISTISYNSEDFLLEKLNELYNAHVIQCYVYIKHKGEDGDKDHIHLRIEPNKRLDPMDLQEFFREYVPDNPKPLGCRPFRPSKEEEWFLYVVHDPEYLKFKYGGGEKGEKIPYKWQDLQAPEDYDTEIAFIRAKAAFNHSSCNMAKRLSEGESPLELIMQGENVHVVNAVSRALQENDYQRLVYQLEDANRYIRSLTDAIQNSGFSLVEEGGLLKLV